jgi:hypothetical protein
MLCQTTVARNSRLNFVETFSSQTVQESLETAFITKLQQNNQAQSSPLMQI